MITRTIGLGAAIAGLMVAGCANTPEMSEPELLAAPIETIETQLEDRWVIGLGSNSYRDRLAAAAMRRHDELGITPEDLRLIYRGQLAQGMTRAAVAFAWGPPSRRTAEQTPTQVYERWRWYGTHEPDTSAYTREAVFVGNSLLWHSQDVP